MTYNLDVQLEEIRNDLRKFRQVTSKSNKKLAAIRSAAVAPGVCPVYYKFKRAGFSHITSDSICRSAHRYGISSRLPLDEILTAIKIASKTDANGVGFQDNSSNSKGPGNGVPDKEVTPSSMGSDYESCVKSLSDPVEKGGLGIDIERAKTECETQWLGKGTKYGDNGQQKKIARSQLPAGVRLSSGGKVVSVKGASVQKPAFVITQEYLKQGGIESSNHIRSASTKTPEEHATYMKHIMESHDQAVERRNLAEYTNSKTKSASVKDKRPHWIKTREHVFKD